MQYKRTANIHVLENIQDKLVNGDYNILSEKTLLKEAFNEVINAIQDAEIEGRDDEQLIGCLGSGLVAYGKLKPNLSYHQTKEAIKWMLIDLLTDIMNRTKERNE